VSGGNEPATAGLGASPAEVGSVHRQLLPGERIEWIGRPNPKKWLAKDDGVIAFPAFVFFCFLVGFLVFAVPRSRDGWIIGVFALPLVAGSAYLAFGYIVLRVYRKRHTTYAVTDRRVLSIVRGWGGDAVEAASLGALPLISPDASGPGGRGSLAFGLTSESDFSLWQARWSMRQRSTASFMREHPPGLLFYDIDDPTTVARLIERLRDGAQEHGP
jgi:hypothetical protein